MFYQLYIYIQLLAFRFNKLHGSTTYLC